MEIEKKPFVSKLYQLRDSFAEWRSTLRSVQPEALCCDIYLHTEQCSQIQCRFYWVLQDDKLHDEVDNITCHQRMLYLLSHNLT